MPESTCRVDGCEDPSFAKGMCRKHYNRASYLRRCDPVASAKFEAEKEAAAKASARAAESLFKTCSKCKVEQLKAEYKEHRKSLDGLDSWCRECHRLDALKRYDSDTAKARHQRKKSDPEYVAKRREVFKRWKTAHPDRMKAAVDRWRAENPEAHSFIMRNAGARRRIRESEQRVGNVDYAAILERDGMWCHLCDSEIPDMATLHMDHVIPLAKGGPHSMDNIKPSHATCNLRKGAKLVA